MGKCTVNTVYPTDGNNYIYGVASSWTFNMACEHLVGSDFGISIVFPEGFNIKESSPCVLGGQAINYFCMGAKATRKITVTKFCQQPKSPYVPFTFTINNIMNPPTHSVTGDIVISTITPIGGIVDIGLYEIPQNYFKRGFIKKFTVEPQQLGVGQYPVNYKFLIQPSGEVW